MIDIGLAFIRDIWEGGREGGWGWLLNIREEVSLDAVHPSEGVGGPSFLDIQNLLSDLGGDGPDLQLLIDGDVVVDPTVLDVLHAADDDCSPCSEALQ